MIGKYFILFCGLCPLIHQVFNFSQVQFNYSFSFVACGFGVIFKKPLPNPKSCGPSHFTDGETEAYRGNA